VTGVQTCALPIYLPFSVLSTGQKRRAAIARLLVAHRPVWLLDEPTAGLDSDAEARLLAAIAEHRRAGGRVAIATHQPLALSGVDTLLLDAFAVSPAIALADSWQ